MGAEGDRSRQTPQDRRRKAAEIFANALETPPDARTEFLSRACSNDPELRREVETLLRANPAARAWFDEAARSIDEAPTAAYVGPGPGSDAEPTVTNPQAAVSVGSIVSHYQLEEMLGVGGMGEVYRAHDTVLGRVAAIKVLRTGVDKSLRERLLKEAKTCARLAHPAIAAFFESGTSDDVDFLAIEYVEGETLRQRLQRGPLSTDEALSLTASLLEGLAHAHAAGVLHRDIKPENIMLTRRHTPKLLDFGIAKEIGVDEIKAAEALTATVTSLTGHGVIVGTLGYMSPEQLRGENVNVSTDIFALGTVLYEMLAGERAFPGATSAEKIAATLSRDPPPIQRDDVPSDVQMIVQRALQRDPQARYPTAAAFLSDLRRFATGEAVAVLPNTLAILDFERLSGDSNDDWLGSGIAESLGVDLRRADGLSLVPRDKVLSIRAAFAAQQKPNDAVAVGLAVGCRWVIAGSFQKMGTALRLTTRLVDVSTGNDVWTEKIDGKMDDVFTMQDRLATLAAQSLDATLPRVASERAARKLDAFEYYSRGRSQWSMGSRGLMDQARENFEHAIEIDPVHAPALAWLAAAHAPGRWVATTNPKELVTAIGYAKRAIAADPNLADAHVWLGYSLWRQGKEDALESFMKAAALDPKNPLGPYFAAATLSDLGRPREALEMAQRAVQLGPQIAYAFVVLGVSHADHGQFTEARWAFGMASELEHAGGSGGWAGSRALVAECLRLEGRLDEARALCMRALETIEQSDSPIRDNVYAVCLCILGRVTLAQGDQDAAQVAFDQSLVHLRARPRSMGCGHLVVQALAGQARARNIPAPFDEARNLFQAREEYNFSWGGLLQRDLSTLFELARAAHAIGRSELARELAQRAIDGGSWEARHRPPEASAG